MRRSPRSRPALAAGSRRTSRGRQLAWFNGLARAGLGVVAMVAPSVPLSPWVGGAGDEPAARLLGRALGGRDLALGAGLGWSLASGSPTRRWLLAAALADAGDVATTLGAWRTLPPRGRWAVLGAAGGGVVSALVAASVAVA